MVDVRQAPGEVLDEAQGCGRARDCWHGIPGRAGFSGREISHWDTDSAIGRRRCVGRSRWRGIWLCDVGHAHAALVCDECRTHHHADADGLRLVWEQIRG